MKHLSILTFLLITSYPAFTQIEGDWYGLVTRNGKNGDIAIHITKSDKNYAVLVDFPSENKSGLKAEEFSLDSSNLFLILPKQQIAIDAKCGKSEINGDIVYNGKAFPIILTRNKVNAPVPANSAPKSVYESGLSVGLDTKRPIERSKSLFIEELTWMEVRDAQREGKNSVIVATGGIEQSGPYIPTGKHNYILKVVTEALAKKLGNALIAPIVPFVPEGSFDPPSGHLKYPGSISLREETYEALLTDIVTSYKIEGFKYIILIGDSGGNQWGMYRVARELNQKWKREGIQVVYVPEYYDNTRISKWLKEQGIEEGNEGIHDSFKVTAQIMVLNPKHVRKDERIAANKFTINGVNLAPAEKTIALGKKIIDYQTDLTVEAIRRVINN